ncbi:MAG: hypothetical protein ABL974_23000 [Prosthecobacter sp.]
MTGAGAGFFMAEGVFFTGSLTLVGDFFGTDFGIAFFEDGLAGFGAGFFVTTGFLTARGFLAVLAAGLAAFTFFEMFFLVLLTNLAPLVVKYQPALTLDTCDTHGPGVGRGTGITETERQWNVGPVS